MSFGNVDGDFDNFRRQRIRQGRTGPDGGYENPALRQLEQVEEREIREQQLTREVHEFFASATKQAATIVERMAHDAVEEADERITGEMEEFLIDSFARMNTLVLAMIQSRRGQGGETSLEPNINNLVGQALDAFRSAGTAELPDKHIGVDPFALDLDDVRRELMDSVGIREPGGAEEDPLSADDLLAAVGRQAEQPPDAADALDIEQQPEVATESGVDPADQAATPEEPTPEPETAAGTTAAAAEEPAAHDRAPTRRARTTAALDADLARFQDALKSLVKQGTMSREEARAAWATRLESLGLK